MSVFPSLKHHLILCFLGEGQGSRKEPHLAVLEADSWHCAGLGCVPGKYPDSLYCLTFLPSPWSRLRSDRPVLRNHSVEGTPVHRTRAGALKPFPSAAGLPL